MAKQTLESSISPKEWAFLQALPQKVVYSIKEDAVPIAGSKETVYRRLASLKNAGIVELRGGRFSVNHGVARQPYRFVESLLPSLFALKNARRFGRSYSEADIRFAKRNLPKDAFVTLDFKAWELTRFQEPSDLFVYVNVDEFASLLKKSGFSEGSKGHVILLKTPQAIENQIERTYLDSIASGGRGILDAIAIELLYPDKIKHRAQFPVESITKVQEDMPRNVHEIAS